MFNAIRTENKSDSLVSAAQSAGLSFEASPTGRFIRLDGAHGAVYVVQDAWGDGCLVMELGTAEGRRMRHFLNPGSAVNAAAQQIGAQPLLRVAVGHSRAG